TGAGPESVARLLDFGIAQNRDEALLTATAVTMGTPPYMAPEQIRDVRAVDGRADVYSLGVILYYALSGRFPRRSRNLADLALEHEEGPPLGLDVLCPHLSPALCRIVMRALEPRP